MSFNLSQARELANAMGLEIQKHPDGYFVTTIRGKTRKSPYCRTLENLKYWLDGYGMRIMESK